MMVAELTEDLPCYGIKSNFLTPPCLAVNCGRVILAAAGWAFHEHAQHGGFRSQHGEEAIQEQHRETLMLAVG